MFDCGDIDINIVIFSPPGDVESTYHIMEPKKATGIISFKIIEKNLNKSRVHIHFLGLMAHSLGICNWSTKFEK